MVKQFAVPAQTPGILEDGRATVILESHVIR
jgi:hypothetical protein